MPAKTRRSTSGEVGAAAAALNPTTSRPSADDRFYSACFDCSPVSILVADTGGHMLDANPAALALLGYDLETIRTLRVEDIHAPGDRAKVAVDFPQLVQSGSTHREVELQTKDGRVILADLRGRALRDGRVFGFLEDFREKKNSERALEESERRFRDFFNQMTDAVSIHGLDPEGNLTEFLEVNDAACLMSGQSRADLMHKSPVDFGLSPEQVQEFTRRLFAGEIIDFEHALPAANGRLVPVEIRARLFPYQQRTAVIAETRDITERKQDELELRDSKARLEMALEAGQLGIYEADILAGTITGNLRFGQILGFASAPVEWKWKTFRDRVHPEDRQILRRAIRNSYFSGSINVELRVIWRDESLHWCHLRGENILDDKHQLVTRIGTLLDITEQKHTEQELRDASTRLELALNTAEIGIFEEDLVTGTETRNLRHAQIFGYQLLPAKWSVDILLEHVHPEDRERVRQVLNCCSREGHRTTECRIVWPDQTIHWILIGGRCIRNENGDLVKRMRTVVDITERKLAELTLAESEERFRLYFQQMCDPVFLVAAPDRSRPGQIVDVNEAAVRLLGYTREEFLRMSPADLNAPEAEHNHAAVLEQLFAGHAAAFDRVYVAKDGHRVPVEIKGKLFPYKGKPCIISVVRDITERKQAEQALLENSARLEMALEAGRLGIFEDNPGEGTVSGNLRHGQIFGFSQAPHRWPFGCFYHRFHPDDREKILRDIQDLDGQGEAHSEFRAVWPDGSVHWVQVRGKSVKDEHGQILKRVGASVDITDRKLAEEAIRKSAELYRSILASTAEGVIAVNAEGQIVASNTRAGEILGRSEQELLGTACYDSSWGAVREDGAPLSADEMPATITLRTGLCFSEVVLGIKRPNGDRVWISVSSQPLMTGNGIDVDGAVITFLDITERRAAEQELARMRQQLEAFVAYAPAAIAMFDRDMRYIRASCKWCEALDLPPDLPVTGKLHYELLPNLPEVWKEAHRRGLAGETVSGEDHWTTPAGREVWQHWEVHPWGSVTGETAGASNTDSGGIMILFEDVTRQRQLEAQLRQVQKMEAVGQLAGGVAHDFNNILQVILGYCELIQESHAGDQHALHDTNAILEAARRARTLTHQLLAFSRKQVLNPSVVDLNSVVKSTITMLQRLLPENISFKVELCPALWLTEADPDQMANVLINLAVNARDAMPSGGTLTVATHNTVMTSDTIGVPHAVTPGEYVTITVQDTGTGIDAESMPHLFEPFYTTKAKGAGTGLGLASVYGILKQSSGFVWADSTPGHGACFTVCLPRTQKVTTANAVAAPAKREARSATLLVVDDDPDVRSAVAYHARSLGHKVLSSRPEDALKLALQHAKEIDVLITDIVMPDTSGPELASQVKAFIPDVKVIFISGYVDSDLIPSDTASSRVVLLHKPFGREDLAAKISAVLES
jgi:PAS domain S-box-containing protein